MDPDLLRRIHKRNEVYKREVGDNMATSPPWTKEPWYHGRIDRATADTILAGKRPGLFLVRDSSTCPGDFVLSVSENNKVSHYIVSRRGQLYLIGDQTFTDLPSVIEFYRKHFLDTATLREHAPRVGTSHMPSPMAAHPAGPPAPMMINQPPPVAAGTPTLPQPVSVVGKLIVKGKFDFGSDDPEDLHFRKGDVMTVLRKDEDEWWFARHSDGREGSIPVPYVLVVEDQSQPFYARATMDRECVYDPTALSFRAGDMIKVTKQNENGMWEGELNNRKGHFPFTLVEVVDSANHQ